MLAARSTLRGLQARVINECPVAPSRKVITPPQVTAVTALPSESEEEEEQPSSLCGP